MGSRQAGPLGAAPSRPGPALWPREGPRQPHTPSLLPAGTRRAWWAWPPAASRLPSKALSPAPCPCPTACPPCPTRPTPLLPAKPSSPRQIETTRVTSCSPGGARQPRREQGGAPGRACAEAACGWPQRSRDCPGAGGGQVAPASPASAVVALSRGQPLSCVLCVLVKQKKLVVNSIMNVLVCVQSLEHFRGFVCLAVNREP